MSAHGDGPSAGVGRPPALLLLGVGGAVILALAHTGRIREQAEAALGSGMPAREAALARGFVLGQDRGIDPDTLEDFRRSGLSHLLAASGQNVALLALLAMPVLAALGMPLRLRLVWVLGLIAVYVPLAGAGPSIQRAGIMGALSVLATLAGRRASRVYALALAAIVTVGLNPGIAADVGWQLSFAAVLGILLLAGPMRGAITARIGAGGWRGALADGAAMTVSATLATAPLIAFHFGALSTTTLFANLLALPAVAPAMWLGMLAAAAGQIPGFPVAALNLVNAPLLAYIAQVAAWCGRPAWAYLQVEPGGAGLATSYLAIGVAVPLVSRLRRRRRIAALRRGRELRHRQPPRVAPVLALGIVLIGLGFAFVPAGDGATAVEPQRGLRVSVLDVGEGDAILLQPARAPAILVDGGPRGDRLASKLHAAGVEHLGAAIVTHDQSDHLSGVVELLGRMPVERLFYAGLGGRMLERARAAGVLAHRVAGGSELRSGRLRLDVLWPPPELLARGQTDDEPNHLALVMLARWRDFSMLLSADAEAEEAPIEAGPIDVLKVAHHGSDDPGLGGLLERTEPKLAVISVGAGNPFGHPTTGTLATLASHGVETLRTDRDGTVILDVRRGSIAVSTGD